MAVDPDVVEELLARDAQIAATNTKADANLVATQDNATQTAALVSQLVALDARVTVLEGTPPAEPPVEPPAFDTVFVPGDLLDLQSAGNTVLVRTGSYLGQVLAPRPGQHVTFDDGCVLDGGARWNPGPESSNTVDVLNPGPSSVIIGSAPNVTIIGNGLVVTGYLPSKQNGGFEFAGDDFYGQDFTVQECAAVGMMLLGDRAHCVRVSANRNEQMGWKYLSNVDGFMEDCYAFENNINRAYSKGWEAGGSKFVRTVRLRIVGGESSRNVGAGWWTDIDNRDTVYKDTECHDNEKAGIAHEISGPMLVDGGRFTGNAFTRGWLQASQITVFNSGTHSSSSLGHNGCEIRNAVTNGAGGVNGIEQDRQTSPGNIVAKNLKGLWVHDCDMTFAEGSNGVGSPDSAGLDPFSAAWNNRYESNTYRTAQSQPFHWDNASRTWAQWQAAGNDLNGEVV